jgi:hypothetical protein
MMSGHGVGRGDVHDDGRGHDGDVADRVVKAPATHQTATEKQQTHRNR